MATTNLRNAAQIAKRLKAEVGDDALSFVAMRAEEARQASDQDGVELWNEVARRLATLAQPRRGADRPKRSGQILWWFMQRIEHFRHRAARAERQAATASDEGRQEMIDLAMGWRELALQADLLARGIDKSLARHLATPPAAGDEDGDLAWAFDWFATLVFKTLPIGVAVVNREGDLLIENDEMRRFLPTGLIPSRDPERKGRWRAYHPDGRQVQPEDFPIARALRGESVIPGIEMLYTSDDGREIWTQRAAAPMRDDQGRIVGVFSLVMDIDTIKRAGGAGTPRSA
jgi:PAS domain S-box-containing protein